MYIAVAGNIGAGKTTLTNMLSKHYGWAPKFESVDNNPYLDDFYNDMERWAYHLQIYFFNQRVKVLFIKQLNRKDPSGIDKCIFFFFLWPHQWHMDVPGLEVEWKLQLRASPQPWQHWI